MNLPSDVPRTASIVIVGGGIVGIASAFFLKHRGLDPIVIEADTETGNRTTAMSAHCIRAQFGEPDNIRMMTESLDFYEHIAERCGTAGGPGIIDLCQQGYLFASTNPSDAAPFRERVAQQRAAGLDDVEFLDGDETRRRYPWLSERIAVATFRARDGWIDSRKAVRAMATAAAVPIYTGVQVASIDIAAGRVTGVTTSAGSISTDTVILAAGPFSRQLSPESLPVTLLRRHRVIVRKHPAIPQDGPVTIDANTGAHWRPHRDGALAAWAQPEQDMPAEWPVTPDPAFVDLVLRSEFGIGRLAPFWNDLARTLTQSDVLLTAGQYTMTPDYRPLIGQARETQGLYLHTGYSGHGIMGAPAGSRILADAIVSGTDDGNPFAPARFERNAVPPDVEQVVI